MCDFVWYKETCSWLEVLWPWKYKVSFDMNTGDTYLMGLSLLRVNWRLLTEMDEAEYLESMDQAKNWVVVVGVRHAKKWFFYHWQNGQIIKKLNSNFNFVWMNFISKDLMSLCEWCLVFSALKCSIHCFRSLNVGFIASYMYTHIWCNSSLYACF